MFKEFSVNTKQFGTNFNIAYSVDIYSFRDKWLSCCMDIYYQAESYIQCELNSDLMEHERELLKEDIQKTALSILLVEDQST